MNGYAASKWGLALCVCMIMCGCDIYDRSLPAYKEVVRDCIRTIPHVREIRKMFQGATIDDFITGHALNKNKSHVWNTDVFFGGRYELVYQVDVIINYRKHRIEKVVSKPKFYLSCLARVGGDGDYDHFEWDRHFGEAEWNQVVAANGDFSVVGIKLDLKSPPIPGWDGYVRGWSEPRIHVKP